MQKSLTSLSIVLTIGLIAGFFLGVEYKAYQVRTAFEQAFTNPPKTEKPQTLIEQAKQEEMQVIDKNIGDEVTLATLKFKANKVEEKQTIGSSYGSPKVAKSGTKFVVIDMDATNTTNAEFTFWTNDGFRLVDNQKREFTEYGDTIGSIDKYLDARKLPPSVNENGFVVYEIPNDSISYSLVTSRAGTKELYKVLLK